MEALILVVDDDRDCRELLEHVLSFEGYRVALAQNGVEALRIAHHDKPRLILLDLMMPIMDGYQFRLHQLSDRELSAIPVICISGTHQAAQAAAQLQVAACIQKPLPLDELLAVVAREIQNPTGQSAAMC